MNLGQFLSGAGIASESIRQTEEAERVARENQLKIEEQNRFAAFKAKMAQDAYTIEVTGSSPVGSTKDLVAQLVRASHF